MKLNGQTVSVALCTYNGEQHLAEQLKSILTQTRPPDELVICDDRSTDRTMDIVRSTTAGTGIPVRVMVNPENLGFLRNFEQAIALCHGDIIFLSDQDDVWMPNKLAEFENVFVQQPDVQMVFGNAQIVDGSLRPLGYTLWEVVKFSVDEQAEVLRGSSVDVLLRRNIVQGANMAFRAGQRPLVLPIPNGVVHDAWIALLITVVGRVSLIKQPMMLYRQHGANQLGVKRRNVFERMQLTCEQALQATGMALNQFEQTIVRLRDRSPDGCDPRVLDRLQGKCSHLRSRMRIAMREKNWLGLLFSEINRGGYHQFSVGWWSIMHDLIKCSLNRGRSKGTPN